MTLRDLLTRRRWPRQAWARFAEESGAFTCCAHCATGCTWHNTHPGPCKRCIRDMEATPPLPGCLTDVDGRCITCAALHGVRITHGRVW